MKKKNRKELFLPGREPGGIIFESSDELNKMIHNNILRPNDPETIRLIEEIQEVREIMFGKKVTLEEMLDRGRELLSGDVYGFITSMAKEIFYEKKVNQLTISREEFYARLKKEAISRFGLNISQDVFAILSLLQKEIIDFFSVLRETVWGSVIIDDSGVKFTIKEDAFKLPEFPQPDDPRWEIS